MSVGMCAGRRGWAPVTAGEQAMPLSMRAARRPALWPPPAKTHLDFSNSQAAFFHLRNVLLHLVPHAAAG